MPEANQKVIAVVGIGWVGGALSRYFEGAGLKPRLIDPPKGLGTDRDLREADFFFICVPTPYDAAKGGFDLSYVEASVARIPEGKTVIIKSTVLPGTTESLQRRFPGHRLLFNPEFLREKTADQDMAHPDRQIVGFTAASEAEARAVLDILPRAPFERLIPATEAEMIKYFGNAFLALKVVFANQIYDLCAKLGVDYDTVKDCASRDPRIGPSHLRIFDEGYRGYGGSCFPKDVRALIQLADRAGVGFDLMKTSERINSELVAASKSGK